MVEGYWARWLRRWKWSALCAFGFWLVCSLVITGSMLDDSLLGPVSLVMSAFFSFVCGGLLLGTLVSFVVAAFPSGRVR